MSENAPRATTVVVADDQGIIRESVAAMLDLQSDISVVATASNGIELVAAVAEHRPDVVLTDLRMPEMDGAEATRRLLTDDPDLPVVVLTTFDDDTSVFAALDAGARGYLTKDAGRHELVAAVRAAASGQSVLDPTVQARLVNSALRRPAAAPAETAPAPQSPAPLADRELDHLTSREREVLGLIADGLSNRDIAGRLFVSESTIKTHINNLFAKIHVRDRGQAVAVAFRAGLR
ncbi:response regulator transcription factor [Williamsia sterculiae]|uniref:Two component transcriptional regulator, LuxR family n=1 Tax=Williamsia sterculiae TaxID=1344003 RepID=A0A1N7HA33_9NOCA|nr:response regulator transcription factor [Williamsia sterculiae]SIS21550.1 two component transcriptional regulator, LuxR family [Williamsia sterculiae]